MFMCEHIASMRSSSGVVRRERVGVLTPSAVLFSSSDEKEFRNNTSLGGEATEKKPPKEVSDLADKAVRALNIDVAGVDIVQDKNTGEVYVMEVNEAPQFFSDPSRFKKAIDRIFKEINKSL